jgi:hypothetical protein
MLSRRCRKKSGGPDFVYSLSRLTDPSLNAPGAWVMNQVARESDGSLAIHAPDDTTLVINLGSLFRLSSDC